MKVCTGRYQMKLNKGNQQCFERNIRENTQFIAVSSVMKAILKKTEQLKHNKLPVLILGEKNTGRKSIAYEIFKSRIDKKQTILSLNCQGLSDDLIKIQLFGDKHGEGLLTKSYNNLLFIENVDVLSLDIQYQLFQYLKSLNYRDNDSVQVVASASIQLPEKVKSNEFREDLFSFLNQNLIIVPSLKERTDDIPELLKLYLNENHFKGSIKPEVYRTLKKYSWPGNIMELKNLCVNLATFYSHKTITNDEIPDGMKNMEDISYFVRYNPKINLKKLNAYYIAEALKHFNSKKEASEALGVSVKTIYNKFKED